MSVRRVRSFLVVLALATTTRAISVDDVVDIISLGKEIGQEVISSWDVIGKPFNVSEGVAIPYVHRKEREILEKLGQVSRAIERLEVSVQSIGQLAVMISKKGHRATRTELLLHEMSVLLSKVSSSNSKMREYVDIQTGLERSTLEDFASRCVSHDSGALPGLLERIHSIVVPPHKNLLGQGLFQILVDHFKRISIVFIDNARGKSLMQSHSLRTDSRPLASRSSVSVARAAIQNVFYCSVIMRLAALFALLTVAAASELTQVDHVRQKFYNLEQELWVNVTDPQWRDAGLGGDVELTKAFAAFNEHVESIPRIKRITLKSWLWTKVSEKLVIIDGFYKNFMEFVMRQASPASVPSPVRDWLDMAETVLMDPRASVAQAVRKLHGYLEHADMFRSVLQDEDAEVCDLQLSAHQLIFDMYNTIALTEIKGYAMMQFSWMLLRIYGRGNFTQEASLTRQRYAERTGQTATAARAALASAKRDLYKCEPSVYNADTFAEVTRLLQGYIENEVDMNPDNTCKENCGYYTLAENYGCYKDQYCVKQSRCNGRIIDCQFVDSDMWVCPASHYSSRRYEYIEYENGRVLGKGGKCDLGTTKVDSWWRWLFWHCSYCMCLCDDASYNSHRYFSLRPSVSDIARNKVVTGIRLVKVGRVFHLKIHQGTLVERGFVESSEEVQVKAFDPSNADVKDGVDYHKLTYERRAIDLDELDSPSGYVLTGVRFQMIGAHLHFEIRSTPFNYTTGKLWPEKSQWISNDNTEGSTKPRSRMQLHKPDLPTRGDKILKIDSTHDQYIEFTHSDFDADAAQSTVPFIDVQPVVPSKASNSKGATLNSGAGVYHRGAPGSGGFIAVKLLTYDYSQHVKAEPPPDELLKEDEGFTTEISNKVEAN